MHCHVALVAKPGIVLDVFDRHTRFFETLNEQNPVVIVLGIAASARGIPRNLDELLLFIIAQRVNA